MSIRTAFTELVGCRVPIQLAPMGGVVTPSLLGAVTGAGAMGGVAAGFATAGEMVAIVDTMDAAAAGPYVVNVLIPFLHRDVVEVLAERVKVVDFYHGAPDPQLVELVHAGGALAEWQVGSLDAATAAADAGCDLIVVRGVEGGGRMYGTESLWPLLAEVVEAVDVPVLAAGGIGSGRGLAAALAAGAAGVRMGTRFLAAAESGLHPAYRDAVIAASGADSVLTDEFREGWPDPQASARVLGQSLVAAREFAGDIVGELQFGDHTYPVPRFGFIPPLPEFTGDVAALPMYAGESVRFVTRVEPAASIVRDITESAMSLLESCLAVRRPRRRPARWPRPSRPDRRSRSSQWASQRA